MTTIPLPTELLALCVEDLSGKDLKHLRLASQTLARKLTPFLFTSIYLSRYSNDLEQAESVLRSFKNLITTIVISPLRYPGLSPQAYKFLVHEARQTRNERVGDANEDKLISEHMSQGFKEYRRVQRKAANKPSGLSKLEDILLRVFQDAPRVRKVVITHRQRFSPMEGDVLAQYCHLRNCSLSPETHAMFRLTPLEALGCNSVNNRELKDLARVLLALIPAGTGKIKEIVMDPLDSRDYIFQIPFRSLESLSQHTPQVATFMASLTKLRLNIDIGGPMTRFFTQTRNLRCLLLETDCSSNNTFKSCLEGCQFPELRILILKKTSMAGADLQSIFGSVPKLKYIVLEGLAMKGEEEGQDLLEQIKIYTALETAHIGCIFCYDFVLVQNPSPHWEEPAPLEYRDLNGDVAEYLLRDGPNPFSGEELDRYRKSAMWHPQYHRLPMDMAEQYYQWYF